MVRLKLVITKLSHQAKTNYMLFSLRPEMDNLQECESVKFLSVYIDPKFNWQVYAEKLSTRLFSAIFLLKNLMDYTSI